MADIIFIEVFGGLSTKLGVISPNTNFSLLTGILEREGYSVRRIPIFLLNKSVVDNLKYKEEVPYPDFEQLLIDENPRIVGFTAHTPNYKKCIKINNVVKKVIPHAYTCVGNCHVTALPEQAIVDGFDYVFRGEAFGSFLEFTKSVFNNHPPTERIIQPLNIVEDLDILPFIPDHTYDEVTPNEFGQPIGPLSTSLTCPHGCEFCSSRLSEGEKWKKMTPKRIVEEIKHQHKRWGFSNFMFTDPNVIPNQEGLFRLIEINNLLDKEELDVSLIFFHNLSVIAEFEKSNPKLLDKALRKIKRVIFGLESIHDEALKAMQKPLTFDEINIGIEALIKRDIPFQTSMILGNLYDTYESLEKTFNFIKSVKPLVLAAPILTPFPSTPLYWNLKANNLLLTEDWDLYDYNHLVFKHPIFSVEELQSLEKHFLREFYDDMLIDNIFW